MTIRNEGKGVQPQLRTYMRPFKKDIAYSCVNYENFKGVAELSKILLNEIIDLRSRMVHLPIKRQF
jgi:hypothetical protein